MIASLVFVVILNLGGASRMDISSEPVDPCNQYKTIEGINYTLTTNPGSNTSCDGGCLYMRDDGNNGNICVEKPAEFPTRRNLRREVYEKIKGCPSNSRAIDKKKIVAGYRYDGHGSKIPELACTGHRYALNAEYRQTTGTNYRCYTFGSMIINPGCKIIFFKDHNFGVDHKTFGPGTYELVDRGMTFGTYVTHSGIACIRAFIATCQHSYPTCVPTDGWETVIELDNTKSITDTTFTYIETVGTTFSEEIQLSFGISHTLKTEVKASFFDIFSAGGGHEFSTSFDWKNIDTTTRSESTTSKVTQTVPAGVKVSVQQAVGHCGSSTINTQLFRTISG